LKLKLLEARKRLIIDMLKLIPSKTECCIENLMVPMSSRQHLEAGAASPRLRFTRTHTTGWSMLCIAYVTKVES